MLLLPPHEQNSYLKLDIIPNTQHEYTVTWHRVLFFHGHSSLWQWQSDAPGLGDVLQQQTGDPPMSEGVPVDSIINAVLQREAKVVVQVQHIHFVRVGQSTTVKIGFNHIITQQRSLVLNLGRTAEEKGRERYFMREDN